MTKEKAQARRDRIAQMRAQQRAKERRAAVLMWGIGGLVILLLVGSVAFYIIRQEMDKSEAEKAALAAQEEMLPKVKDFAYKGAGHVNTKVAYKETPPAGGEHNPAWQTCGIYEQPINNENAVHSMEHGAVWITYQPDLPAAEVDKLKALAGEPYMLLSPYPGLPSKIVASSWNHQIQLDSASSPDLNAFILKFRQGEDTPELGASCDGGETRSAADAPLPPAGSQPAPQPSGAPSMSTDAPAQ
ncbi:DUF3105 domain-containing protein [Herbidospora sp. NEAU-GS84]|uniref:DUF3105 domain-containing protein n=1 Tax=Herbidospora solisilvae TaxID=2696284 RepID=A0A7C9J328_9ACTN|nr:DUF3105 domain-containing protein [Herbidospora solisilvae]NAS22925.1 DUF3105 domain-containing protein [Herbidospora solisilvae]